MTQQEFQQRYRYDTEKDLIGEGGFSKVYKAFDTLHGVDVAIKIAIVNPEKESMRLKREVEIMCSLPVHPNIAHYEKDCYTFSLFTGTFDFSILHYYEEGNLLQLLKRVSLSPEKKHFILTQLLEGIRFLHENKIIHRDLKPQNVLILKSGNDYIPKISDFGISKELEADKSKLFSNSLMGAGTLSYASPEQLKETGIRKNSDLWSFGVIAYQLFTGKLPFVPNKSSTDLSGQHDLLQQIRLGVLPKDILSVPEPWQTIIRQCLIPDPAKRIKHCSDCEKILSDYQKEKEEEEKFDESSGIEAITNVFPSKPKSYRKITVIALIVTVALVSAGLGAVFVKFIYPNNTNKELQSPNERKQAESDPEAIVVDSIKRITDKGTVSAKEKSLKDAVPGVPIVSEQPQKTSETIIINGHQYAGKTENGKPHGRGRMTYLSGDNIFHPNKSKNVTIDAGDYLEGRWINGKPEYVILYDKNANRIDTLIYGR